MKQFVIFDENAINHIIENVSFQSVEYNNGKSLVNCFKDEIGDEVIIDNLAILRSEHGIVIAGIKKITATPKDKLRVLCFDLTTCDIYKENPEDMLTVLHKAFRLSYKVWEKKPFSIAERTNKGISIVFPFNMGDKRRIVIHREIKHQLAEHRDIDHPLLAYKYGESGEDKSDQNIDLKVFKTAIKEFNHNYAKIQVKLNTAIENLDSSSSINLSFLQVHANEEVSKSEFIYLPIKAQTEKLTNAQRDIVEDNDISRPIRIDGAAGTGKTVALLLRAYNLLCNKKDAGVPFSIVFFSHNESTLRRNIEIFTNYDEGSVFIDGKHPQRIKFTTLLEYCREHSGISINSMIELDASDSKDYQLLLIEDIINGMRDDCTYNTYRSVLSEDVRDLFDGKTAIPVLCSLVQYEFSIQIKGRSNQTLDEYADLQSIPNGLPCRNKKDKELVFTIFKRYQRELSRQGYFDVDDVVIEALARLNAPVWNRDREREGYDYIFVDEMHLFNKNEQSVFHLLTRDREASAIPMCFALDYSQAIGDRGDISLDYISTKLDPIERNLKTVFRSSPQIAEFCASVAASGTLMFANSFINPYAEGFQSAFTASEELTFEKPRLYMYNGDDEMYRSLSKHVGAIMRKRMCKPSRIALIWFDEIDKDTLSQIKSKYGLTHDFQLIDRSQQIEFGDRFVVATPYDINGLEFDAVILVGVDDGRVPQRTGTSDIKDNFITYMAYNQLYLAASRARYDLIIVGNKVNGESSCLSYSIQKETVLYENGLGE